MAPPGQAAPGISQGLGRWLKRPATRVAVVLGCAIFATALFVVDASHRTRELYMSSESLRAERDALAAQRGRLLLERSTFSAYNRVETLASEALSMRMPEPDDTRLVQASSRLAPTEASLAGSEARP